jgi:transcriptional regulator with XRE-family HTH domain
MHETGTKDPNLSALRKRLRAARRQLELSQLQVAIYAGISQSQLSLFEHGHAYLEPDVLDKVRDILGMRREPSNRPEQ